MGKKANNDSKDSHKERVKEEERNREEPERQQENNKMARYTYLPIIRM